MGWVKLKCSERVLPPWECTNAGIKRGLLDCFHWTHHFSQNEAHVTSPPEVNNATWVHSAITSTSVQDSARKKYIPKIYLVWHHVALQSYEISENG